MVRLLLLAPLFLGACGNPCVALCDDMARYAKECGYDVSQDEIDACHQDNASSTLTDERAQECIEAGDPDQLREWWSCDDLADNYQNAVK
jgi:hypothetical protein